MKSLDTNILIYASNQEASEHEKAKIVVQELLQDPGDWILSDQVLIEFYRALRNPKVFETPMTAVDAWKTANFYREEVGCQRCCFELEMWQELAQHFRSDRFEAKQTFDGVLAVTLLKNGVNTFFTRNIKDFKKFGFSHLINPID